MRYKSNTYFTCPCCGYPTLGERDGYEICVLCHWEDDGQDEHDADTVRGGPNGNYSLAEARKNWDHYHTQYRPTDSRRFQDTTLPNTLAIKLEFARSFVHYRWQGMVLFNPEEQATWLKLSKSLDS